MFRLNISISRAADRTGRRCLRLLFLTPPGPHALLPPTAANLGRSDAAAISVHTNARRWHTALPDRTDDWDDENVKSSSRVKLARSGNRSYEPRESLSDMLDQRRPAGTSVVSSVFKSIKNKKLGDNKVDQPRGQQRQQQQGTAPADKSRSMRKATERRSNQNGNINASRPAAWRSMSEDSPSITPQSKSLTRDRSLTSPQWTGLRRDLDSANAQQTTTSHPGLGEGAARNQPWSSDTLRPNLRDSSLSSRFVDNRKNNNHDDRSRGKSTRRTDASPVSDMSDVSALRAAFTKTALHKNRANPRSVPSSGSIKQRVNLSPAAPKSVWREQGIVPKRGGRFDDPYDSIRMPKPGRGDNSQGNGQHFKNRHRRWSQNETSSFTSTMTDFQEKRRKQKRQREGSTERVIELPTQDISILDLSILFRVKKQELMRTLASLGVHLNDKHDMVDIDTMELVALELGLEVTRSHRRTLHGEDNQLQRRVGEEDSSYESFPSRPPVVCLMGHVDHGKTTLSDALRARSLASASVGKSKKKKKGSSKKGSPATTGKVAGTEAGGITQVISAFQVALENQDAAVTFLDTPGHAAFRSMRQSGSNAADVIVLVIAADDGVSPQTVEILNFYKSIVKESGGISLVVAMTKIDKPGINIDEARTRIENQLLEQGIMTESFGSEETEFGAPVQLIPVSGLTGEGVDDLVEGLALQSEMMDLRADTSARAEGIVLDARMEKGLGVVADCIVRWGSMARGDVVVSGVHSGKIKTLKDVHGAVLKEGMPSQPVRIIGFKSLPKAGDPVFCVVSEEVADRLIERREMATAGNDTNEFRPDNTEDAELHVSGNESKRDYMMQNLLSKYGMDGETESQSGPQQIRIPIIIKADADGTLEALRESMLGIGFESSHDMVVDPISTGIGPVSTNDVQIATESGATIFSFNVKQNDQAALSLADSNNVTICSNNVIYTLLDKAKEVFAERLPPVRVEHIHGKAKVQAVFDINNKRDAERIAGLQVLEGSLFKSKAKNPSNKEGPSLECIYRVIRNRKQISPDGDKLRASSLRKVKQDVEDVRRGDECGLGLEAFVDFEEGDTIECYSVEQKPVFV